MGRPRHAAPPRPDTRTFRPEIEGLRAVAALLVAVYHVWFGRVSGGVDVFFLIAGLLITTSLLGQVERSGRVDIGRYLGRLAKRLLPASFTVLLAVLVATKVWMPVTREAATYSEIVASALYFENWALAAKSVDYLARDEASSPVQHFWAMSIQGQFYVIWLVVFAVALLMSRGDFRKSLASVIGALFVLSLTYSVYLTAMNQPLAYFHTGTRVWEFAAGGLLALILPRLRRLPATWGALLSWAGLVMIVVTGFALPVSDAFPGYVALWPLTGAVLVLLGSSSQSPWGANMLLSSRPLVYLGGVSYGLYLWHWPILTFYLLRTDATSASLGAGFVIIGASIMLAIATTRLVERPVRSGRTFDAIVEKLVPLRRWSLPAAGLLSMLLIAGMTTGLSMYSQRGNEGSLQAAIDHDEHPGAVLGLDAQGDDAEFANDPIPSLTDAVDDHAELYDNGCHQGIEEPDVVLCEYGDTNSDTTVMLVGGSHSAHWFPAMEVIAENRGWHLTTATKSACLFSTDPNGSGAQLASCISWNEELIQTIVDIDPDLVIMTSTRGQGADEHVPAGYVEHWATLDENGIEVAAIRDTPRFDSSRIDCLAQHGMGTDQCDEPRESHLADESPTNELDSLLENVTFIDLSDYFCDETCYAVVGNVVVYYDAHHITTTYARTVAPMLVDELSTILD